MEKQEFWPNKKKNPFNTNFLLKLNYDKTNNKVNLTVHKTTQNIVMPSSFSAGVTKVKISDYSSTITMSAVNYNQIQQFIFTTEDGVLSKILFSSKFYDTDSEHYHKVILQEKLNGSYIE